MQQLLVIILKRSEIVDTLMQSFAEKGIKGGTVVETTGMARFLSNSQNVQMLAAIGTILGNIPPTNGNMIMLALPEEQVETAKDVVHEVCGDLSKPNAGVMFALPISFSEGII